MSKEINELITTVAAFLLGVIVVGIALGFVGLLVWLIWPGVVPFVFPKLVEAGVIAGKISIWRAILLSWLCGLLFRGTNTKKND